MRLPSVATAVAIPGGPRRYRVAVRRLRAGRAPLRPVACRRDLARLAARVHRILDGFGLVVIGQSVPVGIPHRFEHNVDFLEGEHCRC